MEFKFKIKVGQTEIEITETANNQREFFEKTSFFSGLPTKAPGGSDDLKIVYRKTKGGDEFYSIVSEAEKLEYKFGIHKNSEKTLFPKGWEPLFEKGGNDDQGQSQDQDPPQQNKPAGKPAFAGGKPAAAKAQQQEAPAEQQEAAQEPAPTPTPAAAAPKINLPKPGAGVNPGTATPPAKAAGNSPQVSSVLNKYLKKS